MSVMNIVDTTRYPLAPATDTGDAVASPTDTAMLARAADRHVPVILLDGDVTRLTQSARSNVITCQAEVEFVVRKIPEQTLRSTLSGSAAAMGSGTTSARDLASIIARRAPHPSARR